jgi:hypothetical protein
MTQQSGYGFKVISMERMKRRVNPSRIQKKLESNWV